MSEPHIIEKLVSFEDDTDHSLVIKQTQELPDDYLSDLRKRKIDTLHTPMGDFYQVAEIPTLLVDKWHAEGFDIMREPIRAILDRLRREDLDIFITTTKRI